MGANSLRAATAVLLFVMLTINIPSGHSSENMRSGLNEAFIETAFGEYPLETTIKLLITKNIPIPIIIEEARKAGFSDNAITSAIYKTLLDAETVIMASMLSHMSSGNVLKSLDDSGVHPKTVLNVLIKNVADVNRILDTCKYLLNMGYTKAELIEILIEAGADRNTILKASRRFNIPSATILEAYEDIHGDPGRFGHVYNRFSLPHPALFAVGIARIHNCDICKERPVISPKRP